MSTFTGLPAPTSHPANKASGEVSLDVNQLLSMIEKLGYDDAYELTELASHADPHVRLAVVTHDALPYSDMHEMMGDSDPAVAVAAKRAQELRKDEMFDDWDEDELLLYVQDGTPGAEELALLAKIESTDVQAAVAAHDLLPAHVAEHLASYSDNRTTWAALLDNPNVQGNVVGRLWSHACYGGFWGSWADSFIAHPNTPTGILEDLTDYWDEYVADDAREVLATRRSAV